MGRPELDIDPEQVMKLAQLGCPVTDIAFVIGCHPDTLHNRFSAEIAKGRSRMRTRLRQLMWGSAEKGNITMQIFLSKQYLGFSDKVETVEGPIAGDVTEDDIKTARG